MRAFLFALLLAAMPAAAANWVVVTTAKDGDVLTMDMHSVDASGNSVVATFKLGGKLAFAGLHKTECTKEYRRLYFKTDGQEITTVIVQRDGRRMYDATGDALCAVISNGS